MTAELTNNKGVLAQAQQKEKQLGSLVQELTNMVKEQKVKIAELAKSKQETILELKVNWNMNSLSYSVDVENNEIEMFLH